MPELSKASENPRDYQLVHFNITPEDYAPMQEMEGRLFLTEKA
jgi:hypothetical protein